MKEPLESWVEAIGYVLGAALSLVVAALVVTFVIGLLEAL